MAIVMKERSTVKVVRTKTVCVERRTVTTTRPRKKRQQGVILYRGPSLLDGSPIVVVAAGLARKSKNAKTGDMVATYILSDAGENPVEAVASGGDRAVCGDCPHRGATCYVNITQAPLSVYKAVKRGVYPTFDPAEHLWMFAGRFIRLGSYGDPAAVPLWVWLVTTGLAAGWTGYTHAWKTCDPLYAKLCMASCDTEQQRLDAVASGWRTFRIRLPRAPLMEGEFICPASEEAGKAKTCVECRACSGTKAGGANASPAIVFHGPDIANNWRTRTFEHTVARLTAEESRRFPLATLN
jgi:hypothetical protein